MFILNLEGIKPNRPGIATAIIGLVHDTCTHKCTSAYVIMKTILSIVVSKHHVIVTKTVNSCSEAHTSHDNAFSLMQIRMHIKHSSDGHNNIVIDVHNRCD